MPGFRPRALKPPARLRFARHLPGRTRPLKLFQDLAYEKLGVVQSHRQAASGCERYPLANISASFLMRFSAINKIVQVPGAIVACAAASGGHPDYSDEDRQGARVMFSSYPEKLSPRSASPIRQQCRDNGSAPPGPM